MKIKSNKRINCIRKKTGEIDGIKIEKKIKHSSLFKSFFYFVEKRNITML